MVINKNFGVTFYSFWVKILKKSVSAFINVSKKLRKLNLQIESFLACHVS